MYDQKERYPKVKASYEVLKSTKPYSHLVKKKHLVSAKCGSLRTTEFCGVNFEEACLQSTSELQMKKNMAKDTKRFVNISSK